MTLQICDHLAANADRYRLFVDEDSVKGGFEGHVREMRQPGQFAVCLSLYIACVLRTVPNYQAPTAPTSSSLLSSLGIADPSRCISRTSSTACPSRKPLPALRRRPLRLPRRLSRRRSLRGTS